MARRKPSRIVGPEPVRDPYGLRASTVEMFTTGCVILDCVLGGGWAYSRVANIIGDKATGKTLLAIEAAANFGIANPKATIVYTESEAAFDETYAESLGLPVDRVEFPDLASVEDVFEDIEGRLNSKERTLYIIDSLDALTDRAEQGRKIDEATYGTKAKVVSTFFRRINKPLARSGMTLMVVSQVRDNIVVGKGGKIYGEKQKRSGGHAIDFYATHALWLAKVRGIFRTLDGVKFETGIQIKARCKKNKVGTPSRDCIFPLIYSFGMEDVAAGIMFLLERKKTKAIGMSVDKAKTLLRKLNRLTFEEYERERRNIGDAVREVWAETEEKLKVKRRKYPPSKAKKA